MPWLILALMGAAAFLYGVSIESPLLCLLTKPVPVLALLGWLHDAPVGDYRRWIGLARLGTDVPRRSALLAAAGALSFAFSDSLIGIDRFVVKFAAAPHLIIIAYWLGQWGIAASAFSQKPR